jgi:ATPase subunit of ABC transporter with duplicated ATPase domains
LTKELIPLEGNIKHGSNLEITYFDQHRTELNKEYREKKKEKENY